MKANKFKAGTQAFAVIADDVFRAVCQEHETIELSADMLYTRLVGQVKVSWPAEVTEKEIKKLAREGMEKVFADAGIKRAEDEQKGEDAGE
jgi:hypothetical protein